MTDTETDNPIDDDPTSIARAHQHATVILEQAASGMLRDDTPSEVAISLSRAVVTLAELLETGAQEHAAETARCETLEVERNEALKRARAAEAEQLPEEWYWSTRAPAAARVVESSGYCQANPKGGPLQMIGMVPDKVQTACLARMARLRQPKAAAAVVS